jgi:hypothetical protein
MRNRHSLAIPIPVAEVQLLKMCKIICILHASALTT